MSGNGVRQTRANAPINDITRHCFNVCSDLPNLGRIGIFSCDACDRWRTRDICGRKTTKPRHEIKRFWCTRGIKHLGPIRIRIVCGIGQGSPEPSDDNHVVADEGTQAVTRRGPKRKALAIPSPVALSITLHTSDKPQIASVVEKAIESKLKAEKEVSLLRNEIMMKNQKIRDLQKKF
jgi:hypothetical protein